MRSLFILIAVAAASSIAFLHSNKKSASKISHAITLLKNRDTKTELFKKVRSIAGEVKLYAENHHYNSRYCFLIDMKLPSGTKRFFVYDLKADSILIAGLVAHGYGNSSGSGANFSNIPGSNSSSLGKYKIGNAYNGRFGLAFKLYGLDSSNSNAFNRFVVLHAHECVPAKEVAPQAICMSQGCPTVAPVFLNSLRAYLDNADKPILLRIFY
jgi:hypothetical protein